MWVNQIKNHYTSLGRFLFVNKTMSTTENQNLTLRRRLHEIIFEADTPSGKCFDIVLIASILLSVIAVMLDSVQAVRSEYGDILFLLEWGFTLLFTIEYFLRLYCVGRPRLYATSFYGIVDILAILPTYVSLLLPGSQFLLVIRILRVLRIFRVFKLVQYLGEVNLLLKALRASGRKIAVFLFAVLTLVTIFGSLMYIIEEAENGFTSIPRSMYWAIVTLTTVGYGDIAPRTEIGQALAAIIMICGYAMLAVPTGIVTVEMSQAFKEKKTISTQSCPQCSAEGHDSNAKFCKFCGSTL